MPQTTRSGRKKGDIYYGVEWGWKKPIRASKSTAAINRMKVIRNN